MTVIPIDRAEGLDLAKLQQMLDSPAWRAYSKKIDDMIADEHKLCVTHDDALKLRRAQGAIAALLRVKRLPAILSGELAPKST